VASFHSKVKSKGFLFNSGQICVAASRTFIQEDIAPKFVEELKARFEAAGSAMGPSPLEPTTVSLLPFLRGLLARANKENRCSVL
jgi:acyl-CoA reductase-like NAD-dependent aldehyde dehydrogenase